MHRLGDLAAATESEPVDRGDDRLLERLEPRGHGLSAADEIAHRDCCALPDAVREFLDVGACREGALAGAGQDHGAHGGIALDAVERRHQLVDQRVAQRIELRGTVQRDQGDPVVDVEQDWVGHGRSPALLCRRRM